MHRGCGLECSKRCWAAPCFYIPFSVHAGKITTRSKTERNNLYGNDIAYYGSRNRAPRFGGGIKQLEPVDGGRHIIMDYSIHDAIEAGFNHVVFG